MNEMKNVFLNTLKNLRESSLAQWDKDNGDDLKSLKQELDEKRREMDHVPSSNDEANEICLDYTAMYDEYLTLTKDRVKLVKSWDNVIAFAEQNL